MIDTFFAYIPEIIISLPWIGLVDLTSYVGGFAILVILNVLFKGLQSIVIARLTAFSHKTTNDLDDMLIKAAQSIRPWVYTLVSLYIVLQIYTLPSWAQTTATVIFLFVVAWQAIEAIAVIVDYSAQKLIEKDEDGDGVVDPNSATASGMVTLAARIVLWALGGLFILSNLGIEVTSLLAGLGIGGIAIAFALQNILSDLFSSFSIYFDKPFRVGDYILIGEQSGTVEKIGIKTTRLRTLQGEELVVSNAELTSTRVHNFKRMDERRIVFTFGVTYDTSREKVAAIPEIVRRAFTETAGARVDRVHFTTFADSALVFEVVYYVESSDYAMYLDIQEQVNLMLMELFASEEIEFAYPTQMLYVKKVA